MTRESLTGKGRAGSNRRPWDRRPGETARAYAAFRQFRDMGARRSLLDVRGAHQRTIEGWSGEHEWFARAIAWDDELHMLDDQRRLDAIRTMHENHQQLGRALQAKALAALNNLNPAEIPAYAAARMLELGTKLERDTLTVSVAELQGMSDTAAPADPWEAIARELTGGE